MEKKNGIYAETRTKTNYKNYKDVCSALGEQEYKRGSKEKTEQIKRWEKDYNMFKRADNSFTCINTDFKPIKVKDKEANFLENSIQVGNHSVYFGRYKYTPEYIPNIDEVFLNYLHNAAYETNTQYVNEFWSECILSKIVDNPERKSPKTTKELSQDEKIYFFARDLFNSCRYDFFDAMYNRNSQYIKRTIRYIGMDYKEIDAEIYENARKKSLEILQPANKDRLRESEVEEIRKKTSDILEEQGYQRVLRKETRYSVLTKDIKQIPDDKTYIYTMTAVCEVMRYHMINKIRKCKNKVAIGRHTFDLKYRYYTMDADELTDVEKMIEESTVFLESSRMIPYTSVEDIPFENRD